METAPQKMALPRYRPTSDARKLTPLPCFFAWQDEFMEAYAKMLPDMSEEEKATIWKKLGGTVEGGTAEEAELAPFFGFVWEGEYANEMSHEQILEALRVCATHRTA